MPFRSPHPSRRGPAARQAGGLPASGRTETPLERWDRNFGELLQELRVAQTGVQILFGFLLSMPFTNRFGHLDRADRITYLATLLAAASAAALLIAPVSYHRVAFRRGRKPEVVTVASNLAMLGLFCLLAAVVGSVFLAVDIVFDSVVAAVTAGALVGGYVFVWYALPILHRRRW